MKVLIVGKNGQLARELVVEQPEFVEALSLGRDDISINSRTQFSQVINEFNPKVIINASGYTDVEKAELEPEAAFALNAIAVEVMASITKENNIRFIHISTDYVFDGECDEDNFTGYTVFDPTNPINVYGASKLAGELAIRRVNPENSIIVRTSWLYSSFGNNFVTKMLDLMQREESLRVVNDQLGCPTYAKGLAKFLWKLVNLDKPEFIYHWSDQGCISWYDFAITIQRLGISSGLLHRNIPIFPILSKDFPDKAKRPRNSMLDLSRSKQIQAPLYWKDNLSYCLFNEF